MIARNASVELTHYELLNVPENASTEAINHAYKLAAIKNHPDKNPGVDTSEQMKQINTARDVLLNPIKRYDYDAELKRKRGRTNIPGIIIPDEKFKMYTWSSHPNNSPKTPYSTPKPFYKFNEAPFNQKDQHKTSFNTFSFFTRPKPKTYTQEAEENYTPSCRMRI